MSKPRTPLDFEPNTPSHHLTPPKTNLRSILAQDRIPPAVTLREQSSYSPENVPIPIEHYTSREYHELEIKHMWSRVWQFAAWSFDIAEPGDVIVYRNVGRSVILARQPDGGVKAFENSCLHRGRELCEKSGNYRQLRCPYHGFTWDIKGSSRWIPAAWDFPHIDRTTFGLREVRVEEWNGFLFVNFDPNAKSLHEYLGKMVAQWGGQPEWDFTKTRYRAVTAVKACPANWKAVMDAFIETLHVSGTHPEAAYFNCDTATQYDVWEDEPHFNRFITFNGTASANIEPRPTEQEMLDAFTSAYLPEMYGTQAGMLQAGENARGAIARLSRKIYRDRMNVNTDNVPEVDLIDGTEYLVIPNFIVWPSYSNPLVYRFLPGSGPDDSTWEISLMIPFEGGRPPGGPVYHLKEEDLLADVPGFAGLGAILDQDVFNLNHVQTGMKANSSGLLHLSDYQEKRIRHYHETIERYIRGEI